MTICRITLLVNTFGNTSGSGIHWKRQSSSNSASIRLYKTHFAFTCLMKHCIRVAACSASMVEKDILFLFFCLLLHVSTVLQYQSHSFVFPTDRTLRSVGISRLWPSALRLCFRHSGFYRKLCGFYRRPRRRLWLYISKIVSRILRVIFHLRNWFINEKMINKWPLNVILSL